MITWMKELPGTLYAVRDGRAYFSDDVFDVMAWGGSLYFDDDDTMPARSHWQAVSASEAYDDLRAWCDAWEVDIETIGRKTLKEWGL